MARHGRPLVRRRRAPRDVAAHDGPRDRGARPRGHRRGAPPVRGDEARVADAPRPHGRRHGRPDQLRPGAPGRRRGPRRLDGQQRAWLEAPRRCDQQPRSQGPRAAPGGDVEGPFGLGHRAQPRRLHDHRGRREDHLHDEPVRVGPAPRPQRRLRGPERLRAHARGPRLVLRAQGLPPVLHPLLVHERDPAHQVDRLPRVPQRSAGGLLQGPVHVVLVQASRGHPRPALGALRDGEDMSQHHMDRLTAIDASFLHQEKATSHMHVGAVITFDGPPPDVETVTELLRSRLHLVPRYRQKLAFPPAGSGRPLWVDDPDFNLEYHVRQTALPSPGSEEQLFNLASRIFSQQLDRTKPLWELWVVEGLADGGFTLISKTHHAMVDGISGVDIATVLFDLEPVPREIEHPDEAWEPEREPGTVDLLAAGARDVAKRGLGLANRVVQAASHPDRTVGEARVPVEGLGEVVWAGLNPAPPTPLNVEIGPHRRLVGVRHRLEDFKLVKSTFGTTVNDVVLAAVTGALRDWLHSRGVRTEGLELRALVPVSVRTEEERGTGGNRIAAMRGPLPVYIDDPLTRLRTVKEAMDGLKDSKQAVGAEVLAGVQSFAPPTILAQASRLNFSTRLFNLIVTNVPGPQFPLYAYGREMLEIFPVAFLPRSHGLAIAIMSYNGAVNFGLLGDLDALPDIDSVAEAITEELGELVRLAREAAPQPEVTA